MNSIELIYPKQIPSKEQPLEVIEVWADGSVVGNGTPTATCGWAFAVTNLNGRPYIRYGAYTPNLQTNNRAEIAAVLAAIIDLARPDRRLHIRTDSQYVIKTVTEWRFSRARLKKSPDEIANYHLFNKLFKLVDSNHVTFEWVKGHFGIVGNEIADSWATNGRILKQPTDEQLRIADIQFVSFIKGILDNEPV